MRRQLPALIDRGDEDVQVNRASSVVRDDSDALEIEKEGEDVQAQSRGDEVKLLADGERRDSSADPAAVAGAAASTRDSPLAIPRGVTTSIPRVDIQLKRVRSPDYFRTQYISNLGIWANNQAKQLTSAPRTEVRYKINSVHGYVMFFFHKYHGFADLVLHLVLFFPYQPLNRLGK